MKTVEIERFRLTPFDPVVSVTYREKRELKTVQLGDEEIDKVKELLKEIIMKQFGKDNGPGKPVVNIPDNGPGGPKTSR